MRFIYFGLLLLLLMWSPWIMQSGFGQQEPSTEPSAQENPSEAAGGCAPVTVARIESTGAPAGVGGKIGTASGAYQAGQPTTPGAQPARSGVTTTAIPPSSSTAPPVREQVVEGTCDPVSPGATTSCYYGSEIYDGCTIDPDGMADCEHGTVRWQRRDHKMIEFLNVQIGTPSTTTTTATTAPPSSVAPPAQGQVVEGTCDPAPPGGVTSCYYGNEIYDGCTIDPDGVAYCEIRMVRQR